MKSMMATVVWERTVIHPSPFELASFFRDDRAHAWFATLMIADMTVEYLQGNLEHFKPENTTLLAQSIQRLGMNPNRLTMNMAKLNTPVIVVTADLPSGPFEFVADGSHRIVGRQHLGLQSTYAYHVPLEREGRYRLSADEVASFRRAQLEPQTRALSRFTEPLCQRVLDLHDCGHEHFPHIELPVLPTCPQRHAAVPHPPRGTSLTEFLPARTWTTPHARMLLNP
jgi:hypothetical protein